MVGRPEAISPPAGADLERSRLPSRGGPWNVLHAIVGLHVGGAEMMLYRLLAHSRGAWHPAILSLMRPGALGARFASLEVPIETARMRRGQPSLAGVLQVGRLARRCQPDLVHGWMYHGNLAASLASLVAPGDAPVVWSIHHSLVDIQREKPLTRRLIRLGARWSHRVGAIVYCSRASAAQHERFGFAADKTVIIPNAVDGARFRPRADAGVQLRRELGIDPNSAIVGAVARPHPMKDHANLIRATGRLVAAGVDLHLVMIGVDFSDQEAVAAVAAAGMSARTRLLGERHDLERLIPAFDTLAVPSAWGEAFPIVLVDAMASGVPCVVTDIGDCGWIVGDTGVVVPPRDSAALASGLQQLLALDPAERRRRGQAARARVTARFSPDTVVRRYRQLYRRLIESSN